MLQTYFRSLKKNRVTSEVPLTEGTVAALAHALLNDKQYQDFTALLETASQYQPELPVVLAALAADGDRNKFSGLIKLATENQPLLRAV